MKAEVFVLSIIKKFLKTYPAAKSILRLPLIDHIEIGRGNQSEEELLSLGFLITEIINTNDLKRKVFTYPERKLPLFVVRYNDVPNSVFNLTRIYLGYGSLEKCKQELSCKTVIYRGLEGKYHCCSLNITTLSNLFLMERTT